MEGRRVSLTTISSVGSISASNATVAASTTRFGNDLFVEPKSDNTTATSNTERQTTVRLSLELSPTDKVTYPEVNYARLMRLEEKKRKKLRQKMNGTAATATSSSAPFEENDDDVARIAAELEKKYGCAYGRSRGRSKRDDHCDIGMGYDESDSFIDNTDAYDENIPEEVETVEGGFYINCGALEFKQLNTEAAVKLKTDEIIKMPNKSRKRILSLSSSSDDTSSSENDLNTTLTNDKVEQNDSESSGSTTKSKTINTNTVKRPKKDKNKTSSSKKALEQNGKKKEKSISTAITVSTSNSPKPNPMLDEACSDGSDKDRRQKTVKTTTVKDMLKAKRDSFLKMQVGGSSDATKSANGELRGAANKSSDDESSDSSEEDDDSKSDTDSAHSISEKPKIDGKPDSTANPTESNEKYRTTEIKLPELEVEVVTTIQSFKELAKSKNITGKRFQFDDELTEIFLRIDETLLCIEKSQRSMVFAYLEYHLVLPKYSLLRKAKQLRVKMEKLKTQYALSKLRKVVIEAMPAVINSYDVEVQKYTEMQAANLAGVSTIKMPKKRFPWNSNFRNLLYDVYQSCWISYPVLRGRKETLKDFITMYLKEKVVEVWPNGWMCLEELQKEIEKRKQANKKSKEKKIENTNPASTTNKLALNNQINAPTATTTTAASTPSSTTLNSYAKQYEEFAGNRSSCNSDNDSVASSNASNGSNLKRKSKTDDAVSRSNPKIAKNNNNNNNNMSTISSNGGSMPFIIEEPIYTNITNNATLNIRNDLNKQQVPNSDCQTYTSIEATGTILNSTIVSSAPSQYNPIHSNTVTTVTNTTAKPTAHVIDLDQYSSASDILEKSKQLQNASVNIIPTSLPSSLSIGDTPKFERSYSSDSDGVEIVGVFEAVTNQHSAVVMPKQRAKKIQQLQQNCLTKYNNNNNKKLATGIPNAFDVNTALNALKDLERSKSKSSAVSVHKEKLQ